MKFERVDKLIVKGPYFEVDIEKYGLDEHMVVSFLEQDGYRTVR